MSDKIKTIFIGTPAFTLPVFEALIKDARFNVIGAYSQPDRPVGRNKTIMPPAIKVRALKQNIPVFQPEDINSQTTIQQLGLFKPDLIVVFAYSQILSSKIIDLPIYNCINIHPSLLPRWRGPSPVSAAIISGDNETGVSFMVMDEKMDHGPIIKQLKHPVSKEDNASSLLEKLTRLAADHVADILFDYIRGDISPRPQDHKNATYSRLLERSDGKIHWTEAAENIYNQIRGLDPWPGAYFMWNDKKLKVIKAELVKDSNLETGQVNNDIIGAKEGAIKILEIQIAGKKPMIMKDFLNGHPEFSGSKLN